MPQARLSGSWEAGALVHRPSPRLSFPSREGADDQHGSRDTVGPLPAGNHPFLPARQPVLPSHKTLREDQCLHLPRAELATRSISTVFRASGRCLAFSFLLVASTWGRAGVRGRRARAGAGAKGVAEDLTLICPPGFSNSLYSGLTTQMNVCSGPRKETNRNSRDLFFRRETLEEGRRQGKGLHAGGPTGASISVCGEAGPWGEGPSPASPSAGRRGPGVRAHRRGSSSWCPRV